MDLQNFRALSYLSSRETAIIIRDTYTCTTKKKKLLESLTSAFFSFTATYVSHLYRLYQKKKKDRGGIASKQQIAWTLQRTEHVSQHLGEKKAALFHLKRHTH